LLQKGVRVYHRRVILMQKMQNFSGEGAHPLPRPLPQWVGDTPSPHPTPRHLDLNPSHSEILPTLLVECQQELVCNSAIASDVECPVSYIS